MAQRYAIADAAEARAYLAHPILGARYVECVEALQDLTGSDPVEIFGEVDAVKLRSSLTLFEAVSARPLFAASPGARRNCSCSDCRSARRPRRSGSSAERCVGKECVSKCRSRWSPNH